MEAMAQDTGRRNPIGPFMSWIGFASLIFYAPYPILLIVSFRKPSIVSAMTS
jgi:hypothetical protein